ncbi:MAG: uroporphyrinogen decarboxylase family protein [Spirochaetota bacterium]|mgnify:CR=1 FL=1
MKPRDRVLTALSREKPDRVPFQATFTPEFAARLRKHYSLPDGAPHDPHSGRWNGYELEVLTGQDALQCSAGWFTGYYHDTKPYVDEWGVRWYVEKYDTPFGEGSYTAVKEGPLYDERNIASYRAPDPNRPELYANIERLIREYGNEYYIIGRLHTTVFETAWALRRMDNLFLDFALDPEQAHAVLDIPYRYHKAVAENMARRGVDMIWLGDDIGAQKNLMMSPDDWRTYLKPRMADIIASVKSIKPDISIAYHTDGFNTPLIPEYIEIGIDVLNPVQAESMDPAEIKRLFGTRMSFFGAIDVQSTLPFGKPDDVKREVATRFATVGTGGGWLCAPTHHVQLDTPLDNFFALMDAVSHCRY